MVKLFHNFHFSFDRFTAVRFKQLYFFINLHRNLLIQNLVQAKSHDSVGALADSFTNYVVVKIVNSATLGAEL